MGKPARSRFRSRGQPWFYVPVRIRVVDPPWLDFSFPVEDRCMFIEEETMNDFVGSSRESHAVNHHKITLKTRRITQFHLTPVAGGATVSYAYPYWIPRLANLLQRNNIVLWMNNTSWERGSPRWTEFMAHAFMSFTEQVPTVIDVPNLLRDVFTLKGLVKQSWQLLTKAWGILKSLGAFATHHFNHLRTLRDVVSGGSNGYLLAEFGVKPLIREVESCLHGAAALLRRMDFLRRTQGSSFKAKYSEVIPYKADDQLLGLADNQALGSSYMWLRDVAGQVTYTATAKVQNNLVGLDGMWAGVKLALAGLGGQDVVKFLWDLVPFSFVIDWFYNVGELCDRYARIEPFSGSLDVKECDTSFKKKATARLSVEGDRLVDGPIDYGLINFSEYDRQPGFDCALSLLLPASGLTPHQLGILAGLLGQRL